MRHAQIILYFDKIYINMNYDLQVFVQIMWVLS